MGRATLRTALAVTALGTLAGAGPAVAPPGHRENILRSSFTRIGIGAARSSGGTWYYAQVFGG